MRPLNRFVETLAACAIALLLASCGGGGQSDAVKKQDRKSLQLTPGEQKAEEADQKLMNAVKEGNKEHAAPAQPRGAIQVSGLEYWASLGNVGKVKIELQNGADVNARFESGDTALHVGALNGHAEVVRLLLDQGANPSIKNDRGETPLALAKLGKKEEAVKLLGK